MIEIKQLQFFAACVEEGSFSRAADVLYTSQPNVSKVVRELEQEIGVELFERGGRGVVPTEDGKNLYQYARDILAKQAGITNLINTHRHDLLRISFNHSRSMAQAVSDFLESKVYPVDMRVREGVTEMVVGDVEHFRSDLGFTFIVEKQMPAFQYNVERRGLKMKTLRVDQLQISIGENDRLARLRMIKLDKLIGHSFIRHSDDFFSLENGVCLMEPKMKPILDKAAMSNSVQLVINLINSGMCNLSLPPFYNTKLADGVVQVMIEPAINVHFVCIYKYAPIGLAREFIDHIKRLDSDRSQ